MHLAKNSNLCLFVASLSVFPNNVAVKCNLQFVTVNAATLSEFFNCLRPIILNLTGGSVGYYTGQALHLRNFSACDKNVYIHFLPYISLIMHKNINMQILREPPPQFPLPV